MAALFGVAFAVFLFLAVAILNVPSEATDQELIDWWSRSGNQDATMYSMAMVALSAISLVLFLSYLRERMNGADGSTGNPMYALGVVAASVLLVTAAVRGTIGTAVSQSEPLPGVDMLRYFPELAYTLMQGAMLVTGVSIVLAACAMKATNAFPNWLTWTSFVLGGLTILGSIVVGSFIIPIVLIWAIAASVAVWRSGSAATAPAMKRSTLPA